MGFVDANGLRFNFQEWKTKPEQEAKSKPNAASSVAVLVHGLGSSSHIWDLVGPELAAQGVRAVAMDQRGHGETDQPDSGYDFPTIVADLRGFMDALQLTEPITLIGHSWGASVVLHFAVAHPDRTAGIALVDGGTGSPGERWSWEETETRLRPPDIDGLNWDDLHARLSRNNGAYADPRTEAVGRSLFHVDADGRVTRRFRIPNHMQVVRALWEQRPAELLPNVRCPVLVLPARQSSDRGELVSAKEAGVQRAQELHADTRVRWFEDTVHDVPLQRPDELAKELVDFVTRVSPTRVAGTG